MSERGKKRRRVRPLDERIAIHREWARVARWFIVAAGIVLGLWVIVQGIVALADDPLVSVLKVLCATIGGPVAPVFVVYLYFRRIKRFTADHVDRAGRLEKRMDPGRTSSGLRKDGSDPPGGLT